MLPPALGGARDGDPGAFADLEPTPMPPLWRARLVALTVATAVAGVVAVALLRDPAAPPPPPFKPGRVDPKLGYALVPGWSGRHVTPEFDVAVGIDALGRRATPAPALPDDARRLLVLGDSFGFGWGVEGAESWVAVLAERLAQRAPPVAVDNRSVPGWSPDHAYVLLTRILADAPPPDVVLLQLCSNDLQDLTWDELVLDDARRPKRIRGRARVDAATRRRVLESLADAHGVTVEQVPDRLGPIAIDAALRRAFPDELARRRAAAGPPPEGPLAQLEPEEIRRGLDSGWEFQLRYLLHVVDGIERWCTERGARLRVLLVDATLGPTPAEVDALRAACAARFGDAFLDCRSFLPDDDREAHFYERDPHWRAEAHARAGAAIDAWLADEAALTAARR